MTPWAEATSRAVKLAGLHPPAEGAPHPPRAEGPPNMSGVLRLYLKKSLAKLGLKNLEKCIKVIKTNTVLIVHYRLTTAPCSAAQYSDKGRYILVEFRYSNSILIGPIESKSTTII